MFYMLMKLRNSRVAWLISEMCKNEKIMGVQNNESI